jgi:hypothetical protein
MKHGYLNMLFVVFLEALGTARNANRNLPASSHGLTRKSFRRRKK